MFNIRFQESKETQNQRSHFNLFKTLEIGFYFKVDRFIVGWGMS